MGYVEGYVGRWRSRSMDRQCVAEKAGDEYIDSEKISGEMDG